MKLISEEIVDVQFITEDANGKKSHFIEGVFLQSDIRNRNGRMYPFDTLDREVSKYNENYIQRGRALGELGHPDGPTINLDRVSHKIVSLRAEGKNFIGKAKLLETPMGKIAKNLLDEGVKLGVSSRGLGSIERKGDVNIVKDDFMLSTAADIVADPSAPDAFVEGIMEGTEWVWNNGIWHNQDLETAKRHIESSSMNDLTERKLKVFESFLRNIKIS
jgi:hypothetical protein|tara:strand:+ start:1571 stop:2224 length:654 start_codon:yes stop_codon:yes gene_type:complete